MIKERLRQNVVVHFRACHETICFSKEPEILEIQNYEVDKWSNMLELSFCNNSRRPWISAGGASQEEQNDLQAKEYLLPKVSFGSHRNRERSSGQRLQRRSKRSCDLAGQHAFGQERQIRL